MFGLILIPEEGRDYTSKEALKADWEAGKDFRIVDGPRCSVKDKRLMGESGFTAALFTNASGKPLYELELIPRRELEACL